MSKISDDYYNLKKKSDDDSEAVIDYVLQVPKPNGPIYTLDDSDDELSVLEILSIFGAIFGGILLIYFLICSK